LVEAGDRDRHERSALSVDHPDEGTTLGPPADEGFRSRRGRSTCARPPITELLAASLPPPCRQRRGGTCDPFADTVDWIVGMDLYAEFLNRVLFPSWEGFVRRRPTVRLHRYLEKTQWHSLDQLEAIQVGSLRRLLRHSYDNIPFWRR